MTAHHHPTDDLIGAFAGGVLAMGPHVVVATHLAHCARCRDLTRAVEKVGGDVLADIPPAPMADDARARALTRLGEATSAAPAPASQRAKALDAIPGLPDFVRRYRTGRWTPVALGLQRLPITLPDPDDWRMFLLKSDAGVRLMEHTHTGRELTCVLSGGFRHDGGHFRPGDFDLGDPTVSHKVTIDADEDCVSLVVMNGKLGLRGVLGALIQPFIRI